MKQFNKKVLSIILSMLLVLSLSINVFAAEPKVVDTFIIVHTNDTHGRLEEGKFDGMGFSRIATKINELEAKYGEDKVIILDAGDTTHGVPLATVSKGASVIAVLNAIGYDAMTPGNHDFNYGQERLAEMATLTEFPILSANVVKKDGSTLLVPYTIKEVAGKKVGIFGLSTPETAYKTNPLNVTGLTFENPVEVAKEMVEELDDQTDFIIALGHLGVDEGEYTSEAVLNEVKGIDLFIDGHSHTALETGRLVNGTYIAQAGQYDQNLGIVTVDVYDNGKFDVKPSLLGKEDGLLLEKDAEVEAIISNLKQEFESITGVKVGETAIRLDGEREIVRAGESTMGNLITNAMLEASGAQLAITNGGGIRASIEPGVVAKKDIISVLPFGNYIVTVELTGEEIIKTLEVGIDEYPVAKGAFPHIAGMTMTFDPARPVGNKVVEVLVDGKPIDKAATYVVATNDFLKAGGDAYTVLGEKAILGEYEALDEAVIKYMAKHGTKGIAVEGRIVAVETEVEVPKVEVPEVVKPEVEKPVVEKPVVEVKYQNYKIVYGDTLAKIAAKYNTTYQELAKINGIANPNRIYAGDVIKVPVKK